MCIRDSRGGDHPEVVQTLVARDSLAVVGRRAVPDVHDAEGVVASTTRLDASFNPATAGAVDGVHAIKVEGVGGRPSAVDFEGFDARFIRVIQPTEFGEFALAEVERCV